MQLDIVGTLSDLVSLSETKTSTAQEHQLTNSLKIRKPSKNQRSEKSDQIE